MPHLHKINALLEKCSDYDKDERYMATNDLIPLLTPSATTTTRPTPLDSTLEKKICTTILKQLDDTSSDVQSIAVKCLSVIFSVIREDQVLLIADKLTTSILSTTTGDVRDIYAIGLKKLIQTIPLAMGANLSYKILGRLVNSGVTQGVTEVKLECIGIVEDLVGRFGGVINSAQSAQLSGAPSKGEVTVSYFEGTMSSILAQLSNDDRIVKKRTVGCLSVLAVWVDDKLLKKLIDTLIGQIDSNGNPAPAPAVVKKTKSKTAKAEPIQKVDTYTIIQTLCAISTTSGARMKNHVPLIISIFLRFTNLKDAGLLAKSSNKKKGNGSESDDESDYDSAGSVEIDVDNEDEDNEDAVMLKNELRESCLTGFESYIKSCPAEVSSTSIGSGSGVVLLNSITEACLGFIRYDPNYCYDDTDDEGNGSDDDDDINSNDGSDDEQFSDDDDDDEDDDTSWKVRRAAIKTLVSIVDLKSGAGSVGEIAYLWKHGVGRELLKRLKDREEKVKVDVIICLCKLVEVTIADSANTNANANTAAADADADSADFNPNAMVIDSDDQDQHQHQDQHQDQDPSQTPQSQLRLLTPQIIKACCKLLIPPTKKNEYTQQAVLALLTVLCTQPGVGLGSVKSISLILTSLKVSLNQSLIKSTKLSALSFLRTCFTSLSSTDVVNVQPMVSQVLPLVCKCVDEEWYKVIAEALGVLGVVPFIILGRSSSSSSSLPSSSSSAVDKPLNDSEVKKCVDMLYAAIIPRLTENDIDIEIKESAITAIGNLISTLGYILSPSDVDDVLKLLLGRMGNEITRVVALKTLGVICTSSVNVNVSVILNDTIAEVTGYLRQQNRILKIAALETLSVLITTHSGDAETGKTLFNKILTEAAMLMHEDDLQVSQLAVMLVYDILTACPTQECVATVKSDVIKPLLQLSSSSLLSSSGSCLASVCNILNSLVLVRIDSNVLSFKVILDMLNECQTTTTTSAAKTSSGKSKGMDNISKCIASIASVASEHDRQEVVNKLLNDIKSNTISTNRKRHAFLTLGALGSKVSLSSVPGLSEILKSAFNFESGGDDQSKAAAAFALGHVCFGCMDLLPGILADLNAGASEVSAATTVAGRSKSKNMYLLLCALKEVITLHRVNVNVYVNANVNIHKVSLGEELSTKIVNVLLKLCTATEEGVRSMVAECLGSIIIMKGDPVLSILTKAVNERKSAAGAEDDKEFIENPNALFLWTASTSLKYALGINAAGNSKADADTLAAKLAITKYLPDFIEILNEPEFECKKSGLLMLNSGCHYASRVVASYFKTLVLPQLYIMIATVKERIVDLGPFKHKIDDGLVIRKAALQVFATVLEAGGSGLIIDLSVLTPVVTNLLVDSDELQPAVHQIIARITQKSPESILASVPSVILGLDKILTRRIRENLSQNDLDKIEDSVRSAIRVAREVGRVDGVSEVKGFKEFVEKCGVREGMLSGGV